MVQSKMKTKPSSLTDQRANLHDTVYGIRMFEIITYLIEPLFRFINMIVCANVGPTHDHNLELATCKLIHKCTMRNERYQTSEGGHPSGIAITTSVAPFTIVQTHLYHGSARSKQAA